MSFIPKALRTSVQALAVLATTAVWPSGPAQAQGVNPFVGDLMLFGGNFCPRGWAAAQGQLLAVNSNDALFSLYGTTYGGDGRTTFGLPDLRGRMNIHEGTGPGLSPRRIGERGGAESVTLTVNQLPSHNHGVGAVAAAANQLNPAAHHLSHGADGQGAEVSAYAATAGNTAMASGAISNTGGSQSHSNLAPVLAMTWCVALVGIYPSRN